MTVLTEMLTNVIQYWIGAVWEALKAVCATLNTVLLDLETACQRKQKIFKVRRKNIRLGPCLFNKKQFT